MNHKSTASRKTIFLTGATGVVGQALLPRLSDYRVICLTHQTAFETASVTSVRGDITQPLLGLSASHFNAIAEQIDVMIHAAAVTNFSQPRDHIFRANVTGTQHVLDLAAAARVPVYYISAASVYPPMYAGSAEGPNAYERSKQAAEELIRASGLPCTILRPSIITGDSQTGAISHFQGLHHILGLMLMGVLPMLPGHDQAYVDFVPQDVVADVLIRLLERDDHPREYWLAAGSHALRLGRIIEVCVEHSQRLTGHRSAAPRLVTTDEFARLIHEDIEMLPAELHRPARQVLKLADYFSVRVPLPSSWEDPARVEELPPLPDLEHALIRTIEYWVQQQHALPTA